jgi:hypothetical protein
VRTRDFQFSAKMKKPRKWVGGWKVAEGGGRWRKVAEGGGRAR